MQCLKDYIGLKGCSTTMPDSGLFINSLPGISLETIDKIADSEQQTYAGVFEDVQIRSLKRIETDIINTLGKRYRLKNPKQSYNIGKTIDKTLLTVPDAGEGLGIKITRSYYGSIFVDSALSDIYVQSVAFYATQADVDITLNFVNESLETVYQKVFTSAEGWNDFVVEKRFSDKIIYVLAMDNVNMSRVKLDVTPIGYYGYRGCVDCQDSTWYAIRGSAIALNQQPIDTSNSYGVSITASIKCSYAAIVCANKNLFATSLWYLMGSEIMTERIYTSRLNRWKLNKDEAKELKAYYEAEYTSEINKTLESISVNDGDECVECNSQFRQITVIP